MIETILFTIAVVCTAAVSYMLGKSAGRDDGRDELVRLKHDLVTVNSVRHNLNCMVGDLKHTVDMQSGLLFDLREQVKENKADAAAYNQSKGLWCTDQPELIRHHAKKERFFRLGYPEHKL